VLSVTCAVKLYVPAAVGFPLMIPVVASNARPGGSDPAVMLKWNGESPPVTFSRELYGMSWVPIAAEQVTVRFAGMIVMVHDVVVVPAAVPVPSWTLTWNENVPALVGVPVIAPVDVFSERPSGRLPLT